MGVPNEVLQQRHALDQAFLAMVATDNPHHRSGHDRAVFRCLDEGAGVVTGPIHLR